MGAQFPSLDDRGVATMVVRDFEVLARRGRLQLPNWRHLGGERGPVIWRYPNVYEIRAELRGRDVACWCPLDMPCHGDVLLELANATCAVCARTDGLVKDYAEPVHAAGRAPTTILLCRAHALERSTTGPT